jgi:DNA-binding MarR family transcriptional regulator
MNSLTIEESPYLTLKIHALNTLLSQKVTQHHEPVSGMTLTEVRLLLLIRSNPGLTVSELVMISFTERTLVSKAITSLCQKGFVERNSKTNRDGRRIRLTLTEKGGCIAKQTHELSMKGLDQMMSILSKQECEIFNTVLNKITRHVQEELENYELETTT